MSRWLTMIAGCLALGGSASPALAADLSGGHFRVPAPRGDLFDAPSPRAAYRAYSHVHDFPYWDLIRGPRWQDQSWRFQEMPCREPAHRAWIGHTHYRSATAGRRNPNE
jgi:hypothetical protein